MASGHTAGKGEARIQTPGLALKLDAPQMTCLESSKGCALGQTSGTKAHDGF